MKTNANGTKQMKSRIIPDESCDVEKTNFEKILQNAALSTVRLLPSLATFLKIRIKTANRKGAFLRSGPVKRDILVTPPKDWTSCRHFTEASKAALWYSRYRQAVAEIN